MPVILDVVGLERDPAGPVFYKDHAGEAFEWIWHARVRNGPKFRRYTCFLLRGDFDVSGVEEGEWRPGEGLPSAPLKWAGVHGAYEVALAPFAEARVDLFATRLDRLGVFLHSLNDQYPRRPVVPMAGLHRLKYAVFTENGLLGSDCEFEVNVAHDWAPPPPRVKLAVDNEPREAFEKAAREAWEAWVQEVRSVGPKTTASLVAPAGVLA